MKAE
jgi:hypothetical protein